MALMAPRVTHYSDDAPVGTPENPSHEIVTLPNVLTFLRLVLTFVFLYLFVTGTQATERTVAVVVYAVAACTDWADGLLARATQTVSWAGKVLDPIVDRALLFTGVLGLALRGELPAYRKPITRLRNPQRAEPQYILFVNTHDIDAWIRATWDKAGTEQK